MLIRWYDLQLLEKMTLILMTEGSAKRKRRRRLSLSPYKGFNCFKFIPFQFEIIRSTGTGNGLLGRCCLFNYCQIKICIEISNDLKQQ